MSEKPPVLRRSVERASTPAAHALAGLPSWATTTAWVVLLVLAAVVGGPIGWVLLALAVAFVAWLLFLAWPYASLNAKLIRVAVLLLGVALVVARLLPR
ncbi:DUF6703 family protein [Arsenicicoccus dermatophilus]|uniref:DUF6703 family protein n=1 Tax=Arsenicicoccus dermatophilus TaxID=1076331 RepID=UPI001F4C6460|nr:DUF6703 family protein [Arsenicicoccus dermatophilus]MCH8612776.1 hypothetical protein [Arsenicicoccus dermatophilus]